MGQRQSHCPTSLCVIYAKENTLRIVFQNSIFFILHSLFPCLHDFRPVSRGCYVFRCCRVYIRARRWFWGCGRFVSGRSPVASQPVCWRLRFWMYRNRPVAPVASLATAVSSCTPVPRLPPARPLFQRTVGPESAVPRRECARCPYVGPGRNICPKPKCWVGDAFHFVQDGHFGDLFWCPRLMVGRRESAVRRRSIPRFHCPRTALSENFVRGVGECGARCPTAAVRFMSIDNAKVTNYFAISNDLALRSPFRPSRHGINHWNPMRWMNYELRDNIEVSSRRDIGWIDRRGNGSALPILWKQNIIGRVMNKIVQSIHTPKHPPARNHPCKRRKPAEINIKGVCDTPYRASGSHV